MILMVHKRRMDIHAILKYSETEKGRKEFVCNKWLSMNEYVA
jgi:hypothetical protein